MYIFSFGGEGVGKRIFSVTKKEREIIKLTCTIRYRITACILFIVLYIQGTLKKNYTLKEIRQRPSHKLLKLIVFV